MKILHTSDWHLGKKVNNFPMLEDQKYILEQIVAIVQEERPDAIEVIVTIPIGAAQAQK